MFAESKAHTMAIDLELHHIDVQQSNQHVQYLAAYMPDTFMGRRGMCFLPSVTKTVSWDSQVRKAAGMDWVPQVGFLAAVGNFILLKSRVAQGQPSLLSSGCKGPFFLRSDDQCMKLYPPSCDKRLIHSGFSVKVFHLNCSKLVRVCITAEIFLLDHFTWSAVLKWWLIWIMCSRSCKTECAVVSS